MSLIFAISYYTILLFFHSLFLWIIVQYIKEKPPIRITLNDLIAIDLSYAYHYTIITAFGCFICIEGQLLKNWPKLILVADYFLRFVTNIFLQYLSVGIIIRFVQVKQGHMEIFWGFLDYQVRIMFRAITASLS